MTEEQLTILEEAIKVYETPCANRSDSYYATQHLASVAYEFLPDLIEVAREVMLCQKKLDACRKQKEQF